MATRQVCFRMQYRRGGIWEDIPATCVSVRDAVKYVYDDDDFMIFWTSLGLRSRLYVFLLFAGNLIGYVVSLLNSGDEHVLNVEDPIPADGIMVYARAVVRTQFNPDHAPTPPPRSRWLCCRRRA